MEEVVTINDALRHPTFYPRGRDQLLLGVSEVDIDDALLSLKLDLKEGKFIGGTDGAVPLSVRSVLHYLANFEGSNQHQIREISEDFDAWRKDGRSFFVQYPEYLQTLELAYSDARRTENQPRLHGTELEKVDEDTEFRFLPVVRNLVHVEKPAQLQRAPSETASVVQRRTFKSAREAEEYLRQRTQGNEQRDRNALVGLLQGDLAAPPKDLETNYKMLLNAYDSLVEKVSLSDIAAARGARRSNTLSDATWNHIAKGEVDGNQAKGYHWKGLLTQSLVEADGEPSSLDNFGAYTQMVRPRLPQGTNGRKQKGQAKRSSFFPDAWSETEVRMAIEYARREGTGQVLTVTLPKKGAGMKLNFNGLSYYPLVSS